MTGSVVQERLGRGLPLDHTYTFSSGERYEREPEPLTSLYGSQRVPTVQPHSSAGRREAAGPAAPRAHKKRKRRKLLGNGSRRH